MVITVRESPQVNMTEQIMTLAVIESPHVNMAVQIMTLAVKESQVNIIELTEQT